MKYYIDCEFDGHRGALMSIAIVREDKFSMYIETGAKAQDPWVIENVVPILTKHKSPNYAFIPSNYVGPTLKSFIGTDDNPSIIADSPVDIARFTDAISTDEYGNWAPTNYSKMTFIVCNVDCYPTELKDAVQHNAWWDAMALKEKVQWDFYD